MEVITKRELQLRFDEIAGRIKAGAVFIHPSDTIYGLSCSAEHKKAVAKIRRLKERSENPFSVWVPSLSWVRDNCKIEKNEEPWLKKLPGPYTFITLLQKKGAIAKEVIPKTNYLGIRMPEHWFHQAVEGLGFPIVTTSVNKSGQPFMTSLKDIDPDIQAGVDFIIYEGEKKAKPSKIVHLVEQSVVRE